MALLAHGSPPGGGTTVQVTLPAPAAAGDSAVISVAETTTNELAASNPNDTDDASLKPVPMIVTLVPPPIGPAAGVTEPTVGAAS